MWQGHIIYGLSMPHIGCPWFANTGVFTDTHSRNRRNRLCIFNFLYKDVDFVFICLNIIRSMIREEVDYQIDLSFERNRLSESKFANYDRRSL